MTEKEKDEDPFYRKVQARAYVKRGAAHCFLTKFDEAIRDIDHALGMG